MKPLSEVTASELGIDPRYAEWIVDIESGESDPFSVPDVDHWERSIKAAPSTEEVMLKAYEVLMGRKAQPFYAKDFHDHYYKDTCGFVLEGEGRTIGYDARTNTFIFGRFAELRRYIRRKDGSV